MTDQRAERQGKQTVAEPTAPGWRPAKRMDYLRAPSGYTARWVNSDPDNVARKKEEGWIIMKKSDNKGQSLDSQNDVNDGGSPANEIRYREMIAMMLPDSIKKEREAYYNGENKRSMDQIMKKADSGLKQMGASTYKPTGMKGRIVIE